MYKLKDDSIPIWLKNQIVSFIRVLNTSRHFFNDDADHDVFHSMMEDVMQKMKDIGLFITNKKDEMETPRKGDVRQSCVGCDYAPKDPLNKTDKEKQNEFYKCGECKRVYSDHYARSEKTVH